jgi:hypothetical protein
MISINVPTGKAPLYHKYPRQFYPQGAYIEIDCKNDSVTADYNGEIGNAIPFSVYHGHDRRYGISPSISGNALAELMNSEEFKNLCQRIVDGYSSEWNGNNHVAVLDEDAQEAEEELIELIPSEDESSDFITVWDVDEYLDAVRGEITADMSDETLAQWVADVEASAENENVYVDGDIEEWANMKRAEQRREAIEDHTTDGEYENTKRDDQDPIYKVIREDENEIKTVYTVRYSASGELVDEVDSLRTDFIRAYPEGGNFEIYKTLANHADTPKSDEERTPTPGRFYGSGILRFKSQHPKYNPDGIKILLHADWRGEWHPVPMQESEQVYELFKQLGIAYPFTYDRARRLERERDEQIKRYRSTYAEQETKLKQNNEAITELNRKISELQHENAKLTEQVETQKSRAEGNIKQAIEDYERKIKA